MSLSDRRVAKGRARAQAEMVDTCKIVRYKSVSAGGQLDEETLQYPDQSEDVPADATVIYEGPCRIQIRSDINANIVEPQELEREWAYQTSTLQLPIAADTRIVTGTSGDVQSNDVCLYLTSRDDPSLPGRAFNVQATTHKTTASHRKFRIREAVR
jgi:hypothetical protein